MWKPKISLYIFTFSVTFKFFWYRGKEGMKLSGSIFSGNWQIICSFPLSEFCVSLKATSCEGNYSRKSVFLLLLFPKDLWLLDSYVFLCNESCSCHTQLPCWPKIIVPAMLHTCLPISNVRRPWCRSSCSLQTKLSWLTVCLIQTKSIYTDSNHSWGEGAQSYSTFQCNVIFNCLIHLALHFLSDFLGGQTKLNSEGWVVTGLCISYHKVVSNSLCAAVIKNKVARKEMVNQAESFAEPFLLHRVVHLLLTCEDLWEIHLASQLMSLLYLTIFHNTPLYWVPVFSQCHDS